MKYNFFIFLFFTFLVSSSQTINLNESYLTDYLRTSQLLGDFKSDVSFTLKPFDIGENGIEINKEIFDTEKYAPTVLSFLKGNGKIKILPIDYNIEFNSHHPYIGFFAFVLLLFRVSVLVLVRFPFSWLWPCFLVSRAVAVCSALPSVRLTLTAVV